MRHFLMIWTALCGLTLTSAAHAQDFPTGKMSTVRFRPAVGPGSFVTVEGTAIHEHRKYTVGGWVEAGGPVLQQTGPACVVENGLPCENAMGQPTERASEELNSIPLNLFLHLNASIGLFDRAQLAIDLPIGGNTSTEFASTYRDPDTGQASAVDHRPDNGFALGDPRLLGKVKIWGDADDMLSASGTAYLTLPLARVTGNAHYTGERTVQAGGSLLGELRKSIFRLTVNLGAMYRPQRTYLTAHTGSELTFGVAGEVAPNRRIAFTVEGVGSAVLVGDGENPGEILLGMHAGQYNWRFHIGGGVGLTDAVGTPAGRGFLGLTYSPRIHDVDHDGLSDWEDECKTVPEDRDGFEDDDGCPELDNDGDGVPDEADQCPNEPEDMDGFEDDDGCPELDNDNDGVQDGFDSCPHEQEDHDGDRDMDGCPDNDTDRDGIPDAEDACPDQAEDTDGLGDEDGCPDEDYDRDGIDDVLDSCPEEVELLNGIEDDDGCPEPDSDGDGVIDARDACPGKKETLNGVSDADGCPEGARRLTYENGVLTPTAMLLFNPEGTEPIRPRTFVTLDAAVEFIQRHHSEGKVAVVVHAPYDDRGAVVQGETVRDYLIEKGIAADRVHVDHVVSTPARIEFELIGPDIEKRPPPRPPRPAPQPDGAGKDETPSQADEAANDGGAGETGPGGNAATPE